MCSLEVPPAPKCAATRQGPAAHAIISLPRFRRRPARRRRDHPELDHVGAVVLRAVDHDPVLAGHRSNIHSNRSPAAPPSMAARRTYSHRTNRSSVITARPAARRQARARNAQGRPNGRRATAGGWRRAARPSTTSWCRRAWTAGSPRRRFALAASPFHLRPRLRSCCAGAFFRRSSRNATSDG
jgi:hypothetical protein